VSVELEPMLTRRPDLRPYVEKLANVPLAQIGGTERLTNHAFCTGIDLRVENGGISTLCTSSIARRSSLNPRSAW
jgi:hypothetical protein